MEYSSTHVADALNRVLEQYKNSPKLRALITAFSTQIQLLEDAFEVVDLSRSIMTATGDTLDRIGEIVGASRSGDLSDDIFRILIVGKITVNISQGETEIVISTYALLTNASEVRLEEQYPAGVSIYSNGDFDFSLAPYVDEYLRQIMPAGVSLNEMGIYPVAAAFGFSGSADSEGFGDVTDPSIGGELAYSIS